MFRLIDYLMDVTVDELQHITAALRMEDGSEVLLDPETCKGAAIMYRPVVGIKIGYDEKEDYYSTRLVLSCDSAATDTTTPSHAVPLRELIDVLDPNCKFRIEGWHDYSAIVGNVSVAYWKRDWLEEHKTDDDFGKMEDYEPFLVITPGCKIISLFNPVKKKVETYFETY